MIDLLSPEKSLRRQRYDHISGGSLELLSLVQGWYRANLRRPSVDMWHSLRF